MKKILTSFLLALSVLSIAGCKPEEVEPTNELDSIEVTTLPSKIVYLEEETFDPTGIVVTAHYKASDGTSSTLDVTSEVTYDVSTLTLEHDEVTVTYIEENVTKTTTFSITVNPLHELINDGLVLDVPTSDLTIDVPSTSGNAQSYWFTKYNTESFYIKVVVVDPSVEQGNSIYSSDGIEVLLYTDERGAGLIDGTLMINATPFGDVSIKQASNNTFVEYTKEDITVTAQKVSFNGKYVEGYMIELEIPYSVFGLTQMEKIMTFLPSVYNNQGSMAMVETLETFDSNSEETHTFVLVEDDDTYAVHPWMQLGYTFGNIGDLTTATAYDISNDDGTDLATITLPTIDPGDNFAYMYRHTETELYAYVKLSANEVLNNEMWGKFGLMFTTLDGSDGFFFFIDAFGDGTNMTGTNIGIVTRSDNEWVWGSSQTIASIENATIYQNDNFIELAIYRDGNVFELFVNGTSVGIKSGFEGLDNDTEAVVSLVSFNITLDAKEYGITNDETTLNNFRFEIEDVNNVFIGDSYIDTAFYQSFSIDFPTDINLGVGGTTVDYWKNQIATISSLYNPTNIIIHAGVNDINGGMTGTETLTATTELFDMIHELFPDANIYYISIEPNNFLPEKFSEYQVVNSGVQAIATSNDFIHYIDMVTPLGGVSGEAVSQYFGTDGLHYNQDGYALFTKTIQDALGITRIQSEQNLGDYDKYARSSGWVYQSEFVENTGINEQQIYFEGVSGTNFAASVEINVSGIYNNDLFPKVGLALKSADKTLLFFIDVNQDLNNKWGNYVVRPSGSDWQWGDIGNRQYVFLGGNEYNSDHYKTLEIVRVGTSVYFISDGRVVQYVEGIFLENEETQLSVMTFNLDVKLKNATVYEEADFTAKLDSYQIAPKTGSLIDGDISDWNQEILNNPFIIPATQGRSIEIYAYKTDEGVYVAYNAYVLNDFISDAGNWWENTNVEFKLGTDNQRFAALNGAFSRYEEGGVRDIGTASFTIDTSNTLNKATVEMFIPWSMIEGYDASSEYIPAGFAWKNPTETGSLWADGDFWYVPEADPSLRNVLITNTGLYTPNDVTIDGDYSDWNPTILGTLWATTSGDGRPFQAVATVGTDGFYGLVAVDLSSPLNMQVNKVQGDWWQNPNFEVWTNDIHSRIMIYDNEIYSTGVITDVSYTYDNVNDILIVEYFIPFHNLGLSDVPASITHRIGSNNLNGGWFMPIDPNQVVTDTGLPQQ